MVLLGTDCVGVRTAAGAGIGDEAWNMGEVGSKKGWWGSKPGCEGLNMAWGERLGSGGQVIMGTMWLACKNYTSVSNEKIMKKIFFS